MPPSLIVPAGVCLLGEAADFLRKGKIEPINNNVIAEAIQVFIEATIQAFGGDTNKMYALFDQFEKQQQKPQTQQPHRRNGMSILGGLISSAARGLQGGAEAVSALGKAGVEKQIKIDLAKETADIEFEKNKLLKELDSNLRIKEADLTKQREKDFLMDTELRNMKKADRNLFRYGKKRKT